MRTPLCLVAALVYLFATGAAAQAFQDKPIRVIMPFPTATGPDTVMRLVGERLTKIRGHRVIIENRAGGNGWIAIQAVTRAAT